MVCRLIEGFESSTVFADYLGKWSATAGNGAIGPANGRFGNGHRITSTGSWIRNFDNQATWIVGFAAKLDNLPGSAQAAVHFTDGGTTHCGLGVADTTGLLFAWRGTTGTVLGTASAAVPVGSWCYIECKVTIGDSPNGAFAIRLNGVTVLNLTGQDTRNAGNASANGVRISLSNTGISYVDDIYICDAIGTTNNDFLGDCKVEQVLPTGAGASTLWTPSAGSNYQCVDDVPPNGDTDYVSSATAGQTDTYAFGDLGVASGTVKAVQATVNARKDDAGSRSLAVVARPGSTDRVGATQAVGDSYAGYTEIWNTNPDTAAAWSVPEVNASSFGVRLIS